MMRKKKQEKLGNEKNCKWSTSCKTVYQVRMRFCYLTGLPVFGVTYRKYAAFVCCIMITYSHVKIKYFDFASFAFFREQSSVNKSSDDSDLETPVQAPTPGRGRKRAAGIFKATPVRLCVFP